ncbi:hypothetical protein D3C81_1816610 [compost metagenome]
MNGEFALLFLSLVGYIAYTVIAAYLICLIYIAKKQMKEEKNIKTLEDRVNGE